ncbi:hypothetical protein KKB18_12405, partial [bacterium]|nr:hypothetical protein [bacterium]
QLRLYSDNPALSIENQNYLIDFLPALQETGYGEINFNFSVDSVLSRFEKVKMSLVIKSSDGLEVSEGFPIWLTSKREFEEKYFFDFSLNPGWRATGSWKLGVLSNANNNDRTSPGSVEEPIYATDFYGDFPPRSRSILTTFPLDMSDLIYTKLSFRRWLSVPGPQMAKASVQISDDGIIWHEIWVNNDRINDRDWHFETLDISRYADGKKGILIRWTLSSYSEETDSGWRIDDVGIEGIHIEETKQQVIPIWISYSNVFETILLLDNIRDDIKGAFGLDVYNHDGNKIASINDEISEGGEKIFSIGNYASNSFGWGLLDVPDQVISQIFLFDIKNTRVIPIQVQAENIDSPIRIPFWQNSDTGGFKTYFVILDRDLGSDGDLKIEFFNNMGENINSIEMKTEKGLMRVFEVADFVESNSYGSARIEHSSSHFTFWSFILNTSNGSIMPISILFQ